METMGNFSALSKGILICLQKKPVSETKLSQAASDLQYNIETSDGPTLSFYKEGNLNNLSDSSLCVRHTAITLYMCWLIPALRLDTTSEKMEQGHSRGQVIWPMLHNWGAKILTQAVLPLPVRLHWTLPACVIQHTWLAV